MPFPYPGLFAIDPTDTQNVAANAELTIFDPADSTRTPVALTDSEGLAIPNPLTTNDKGFVGVFYSALDEVGWAADNLVGLVQSYQGIKQQAVNAADRASSAELSSQTAAAEAELARQAAQDAANMVGAPADTAVASLIGGTGSETQSAADSRYSKRGELEVLVTDFGTIGVGNDSAVVESAITYAYGTFGQGGKTVVFPALTYDLVQRVRFRGRLNYRAYGATIKKSSVASGYAVFYTGSDGNKGYASGDSGIIWEGGTFQGDFANNIAICPFALHHTDNLEVFNTKFSQCMGQGHIFDLLGCSNIEIHHSIFEGFKSAGAGYAKSEAIQCDISAAGTSSAPDLPGSYDGLSTKHVNVHHNQFLPLTVGGITYPAPNPMGSHATHESATSNDIHFDDNLVVDPAIDITSEVRGLVHFIGIKKFSFLRNTFRFTTPANTTILGLYSTDYGVPSLGANFEEGATNTPGTLANPLVVDDVTIGGNIIEGCANVNQQSIINIVPDARGGNVYAGTVRILGNGFTLLSTASSPTNFISARYLRTLVLDEMNIFTGPGRPIDAQYVDVLVWGKNKSTGARADAWRAAFCGSLKIDGVAALSCAGAAFYLASCTDVQVSGNNKAHSLAGTRCIALTAVSRFSVMGASVTAPAGTKGIEAYGGSAYGFVDKNIINGGTTTHVDISTVTANQVTETGNLKLTT